MFFKKCGLLFFSKMRPPFFFALTLFPILGAGFFLFSSSSSVSSQMDRFQSSRRKEKLAIERKNRKEKFLARYSNPNPYFLDQKIESFLFLESERKRLLSLQNHPAYPQSMHIEERLSFLNENKLAFVEDKILSTSNLKETEERARFRVQMDEKDLKEVLFLIEDISSSSQTRRPQLLIKEFRMKKIETPLKTEVFEVKMDLIKREFIR